MAYQVEHRVLAVDDTPLMCQFLYETVKTLNGFDCITASDLISAETILNHDSVDMAIIDIQLKGDSGLSIAKNIRRGSYQCDNSIPIFIFTGNAYQQEVSQCVKYDINSVIVKPCSYKVIQNRLMSNTTRMIKINDAAYYNELAEQERREELQKELDKQKQQIIKGGANQSKPLQNKHHSSSVISETIKSTKAKTNTSLTGEQEEISRIVTWPSNKSLGYFQLDRRFKSVEYSINTLVALRNKMKYQASNAEIDRIRRTFDNIEYIASHLRKNYPNDDLWEVFFRLLEHIRGIPFEVLTNRHTPQSQVFDILSLLENAWKELIKETQKINP